MMKVKLLIVGIILSICLIGCSEKPQKSSSNSVTKKKNDTLINQKSAIINGDTNVITRKNNDTLINQKQPNKSSIVEKNTNVIFRKKVKISEEKIEQYYALVHKFKQRGFKTNNMANWRNEINQNFYNDSILLAKNLKKNDKKDSVLIESEKNELITQLTKIKKNKTLLLTKIKTLETYQKTYEIAVKDIQATTTNLLDELTFTYNQETYTVYIADLSQHQISTHLTNKSQQHFLTLSTLKDSLEKENKEVLMVTNAGMFHYTRNPVGLFIEEGQEKFKINLEPENGDNFHLAPNGVFYIDEKGAGIQETKAFLKSYQTKKVSPISATQSGPMLVIDGKHHYKFNHGSKSRKLRSGVGLLPNNRIIFIISDRHNTNFFQFGTIFKDLFGCQQALFLDGAISEMYIKGNSKNLKGGSFGPMLSIIKK